jgi:hypothetical protein
MLFTGCDSFLDTKIDTSLTPEVIDTQLYNMLSYANAFYTPIRSGFTILDGNLFAAATDDAQQTVLGGSTLTFNMGIMTSRNVPQNLYKNFYEGIRAANFFLDYESKHEDLLYLNRDTIAQETYYENDKKNLKWYRAEAHIAKAYYYSELIKRYGGVPIIESTYENSADAYVPRSSYEDVVEYIVKEIDDNKDNLAVNWTKVGFANNEGRFSLGVALAIKAQTLLFAASPLHNPTNDVSKWQRAASALNDLINGGLGYGLESNYRNYFIGALTSTSKETIWAVRSGVSNSLEHANYPIATVGGKSGVCPTQDLVDEYEYTGTPDPSNPYVNRDPRLDANIVRNGSTWNGRVINEAPGGTDDMANTNASRTGYYLKKFLTDGLNLTAGTTAYHHWPVFRYGEMLLEYAEAMNQAYGPDAVPYSNYLYTAREALQLIRNRACNGSTMKLPAVTTTDQIEFDKAVRHERRVELAFEDYRYWDLLRWKTAEDVLNNPVHGISVQLDGTTPVYTTKEISTRTFNVNAHYFFPFTYSDIVLSNGKLEQNPGY